MFSGGSEAEFVRRPDDAITIFQQQVQSAVDVVIRNVILTVQLPQGVSPRRAVKALPTMSDFAACKSLPLTPQAYHVNKRTIFFADLIVLYPRNARTDGYRSITIINSGFAENLSPRAYRKPTF